MCKKIIGLVLALGLLCSLAICVSAAQTDDRVHPHAADTSHCICGGSAQGLGDHSCQDVQWVPMSQALQAKGLTMSTANISVLDSGNYYLDGDVTVTASGAIGSKTATALTPSKVRELNICLNGYSMTRATGSIAEYVHMDSALRFCDCSGTQDTEGSWSFDGTVTGGSCNYGSVAYGLAGSLVEVFGGNFYGNATKIGGILTTSNDSCGDLDSDGDCDDTDKALSTVPKGTINIYNGILNGCATTDGGGALGGFHTSLINIYGGTVVGGSTKNGGAIYINNGTLNISGGLITDGTASNVGGNIYAKNLNITGGTVVGGNGKYGGNVGASHIVITGGTVENGTAKDSYGGNLYIRENAAHTLSISGGLVTGGQAKYGGNVCASKCLTMDISGGTVQGGIARNGGNVYCNSGILNLSGGRVTAGSAEGGSGGGVYISANVTLTVSGDVQVTGNNNSNVYLGGKNTFTVGKLTAGAAIGVSPSEYIATLCTNTDLTTDVLKYIFADSPEATAAVQDGKLVLVIDSQTYYNTVSGLEFFDNTVDQALPMTLTHKLVTEHMAAPLPEGKTEKKVILIGYDAVRADGLQNVALLDKSAIMAVGAMGGLYHSFCGAPDGTQQTATGAGWSTVMTGGWQDLHNVRNNQSTIDLDVHTFLIDLAEQGYTGAFVGFGMNNTPNADGTYPGFFTARWAADVDYVKAQGLPVTFTNFQEDADTAAYMTQLLAQTSIPDVMFTYFPEPDEVGHAGGYANFYASYVQGVQDTDAWGYQIVEAIQARPTYETEDWLIIVTTDHGGIFNNHGRQTSQERMTWIAVNKPVEMNSENLNYARTKADLAPKTHSHCVCGGSAVGVADHTECAQQTWTPISEALAAKGLTMTTANLSKLDSGNYYLDGNVTVTVSGNLGSKASSTATKPATVKNLNICLNGFSITKASGRMIDGIYMQSSLSFCDCSGTQDAQGNWSWRGAVTGGTSANGSIAYTYAGSDLNIYGGNFYGHGTSSAGVFAIAHDASGDIDGDGVYGDSDKLHTNTPQAALNLYNGVIHGNTMNGNGGAIRAFHSADVNIYGGTVTGGSANYGGNIYISAGDLTVAGGVITDGNANYAGNIYIASGTLTVTGGLITKGTAANQGGSVYISTGTGTLSGGVISDSTSVSYGGGVFVNTNAKLFIQDNALITGCSGSVGGNVNCNGTVTMTGGIIEKGWPLSGDTEGGNVRVLGTFNLQGGTVRDGGVNAQGKTVAKKGGNFQVFGVLNISGGTVSGGKVTSQGGNISLWGGTLNLSGGSVEGGNSVNAGGSIMANAAEGKIATVNFTGGTVTGGVSGNGMGSVAVSNAKVTVSGDAKLTDGSVYLYAGKTLTLGQFNEGAGIILAMQDVTQAFATGASAAAAFVTPLDSGMYVKDVDGALYLSAAATVNGKFYKTLQDAVNAAQGSYVVLYEDRTDSLEVTDTLYLDLNGKTLSGEITGQGTLYGMDSTGDTYVLPLGRITGTVSCKVAHNFMSDVTGTVKRYLTISDEDGYTFHRIYLALTHISLKPSVTGVGYKAVFYGDSAVQALLDEDQAFGYTLWVGEDGQKFSFSKAAEAFENGKVLTLRLRDFDVAGYGQTDIYGQVFMKLADGTVIESSLYSYTLRELLEKVASNIGSYTDTQITALQTMVAAYEEVMKAWAIDPIRDFKAGVTA